MKVHEKQPKITRVRQVRDWSAIMQFAKENAGKWIEVGNDYPASTGWWLNNKGGPAIMRADSEWKYTATMRDVKGRRFGTLYLMAEREER